jgi:hypothetical protein
LAVSVKDTFKLFVEILDRQGARFVQNAPDFNARIGVGIGMSFRVPGSD